MYYLKTYRDCTKLKNSDASVFFFMSSSKAHVIFLEMQTKIHPEKQTRQLQRLSDTRWACRYLSLDVIASTFDSIVATLESITNGNDKDKAIEATGLLHQIYCFKFISCLVIIFWRIIGFTKSLSDQLQREELDFAMAADLIKSTSDTLRTLRSEDTWDQTYQYITSVATIHNIVIEEPRQRRKTRRPQRMDDFVCMSSSGQRESLTSSQSLKINVWFPVLDNMLSELDRRFTSTNLDIMKSLQACRPSSSTFLDSSQLSYLANFHSVNADLLSN